MARLFRTTPILLPDFASIEANAREQQFNRQLQLDNYLAQFQQQQGMYLPGDKPAVQQSWKSVESAMDELARNPRSIEARRKIREAQAYHNSLAGAAQFNAKSYLSEMDFAQNNPEKIAMRGGDMLSKSNQFYTTPRTPDEIMAIAEGGSPFRFDRVSTFEAGNPDTHAESLIKKFENIAGDFVDPRTGRVDEDALTRYVEENVKTTFLDKEEAERALVWSRNSRGYNGIPGKLTARDLSAINALSNEDVAEGLQYYQERLKKSFLDNSKRFIDDRRKIAMENERMALARRSAAGDGATTASKGIIVDNQANTFNISGQPVRTVGTAYLAENQRGGYVDPQTGQSYKITQMVKGADGNVYGVALTPGQNDIYSIEAGSQLKMVPINRDVLLTGFSTTERPFVVDAFTRLQDIPSKGTPQSQIPSFGPAAPAFTQMPQQKTKLNW